MSRLILLNKPFNVLCQFTDDSGGNGGHRGNLSDLIKQPGVYPAGRLDLDSEGLVLLTDDGRLQHRIASPGRKKMAKTYWVQVEGRITDEAIARLTAGIRLKDGPTAPAQCRRLDPPDLWARHPPVRERRHIPTSWIALTLTEGRNRQVRRMTAAVGFPTLRLVRWAVGEWTLEGLAPGESRTLNVHMPRPAAPGGPRPKSRSTQRRQPRP